MIINPTYLKINQNIYFVITYSINIHLTLIYVPITLSKINYIFYLFITHFVQMGS
jgi:hypothetical protein